MQQEKHNWNHNREIFYQGSDCFLEEGYIFLVHHRFEKNGEPIENMFYFPESENQ